MQYFLAKTDPETYSIDDFAREKITSWSGVRNPQAVQTLKSMKKGDRVFIYHSQGQSSIVGLASILGNSKPDPKDSKSWLVDFKFVKKFNTPLITLSDIKQSNKFNSLSLVRQGRLSTMPLPDSFIVWLKQKGLPI